MGSHKSIGKLGLTLFIMFLMVSCVSSVKRTPKFEIDYTSNDFGTIDINITSNPFKFTISDPGNGILEINSIVLSGADAVDFSLNSSAPATIKPIETFSFEVTFAPQTVGDKTAIITIHHNAEGSPVTINLSGKAIDFNINPDSNDFGNIIIQQNSNPQKFTISNLGNTILSISNIAISGPDSSEFALNASFPVDINKNSTFDFEVIFNPKTIGQKTATITIAHNGPNSPDTVDLFGEGVYDILFEDDFTAPKAWTVFSGGAHTGNAEWLVFNPPNYTGGSGEYASADSNYNSTDVFDDCLLTPNIDCSAYTSGSIMLEFDGLYEDNPASVLDDFAALVYVDFSTTTPTITPIEFYTTSWGAGQHKTYDITGIAQGKSQVIIGFYYYGQNDYYFDIDNVQIYHKP